MSASEAEAREAAMESLQALIRGPQRQPGDHATAGTAIATGTRLRGGWASATTEPGHTAGPSRAMANTAETQGTRRTAVPANVAGWGQSGLRGTSAAIQTAATPTQRAPNQRGVSNLPAWMMTRVEAPIGHIAVAMDEAQVGGTATTGTAHASETVRQRGDVGDLQPTRPPSPVHPPARPPTCCRGRRWG